MEVEPSPAIPAVEEGVGDPAEVRVLPVHLHLGVGLHVAADEPADRVAVDEGQVRAVQHVLHGPRPVAVPGPLHDDPGEARVRQGRGDAGLPGGLGAGRRVDPDEIPDPPGGQGRGPQGLQPGAGIQGNPAVDAVDPEPPAVEGAFQAAFRGYAPQGKLHAPVGAAVDQGAGLALPVKEDHHGLARQPDPDRSGREAADRDQRRPDMGEVAKHQSSPRAFRASARAFTRPIEPRK